MSEKEQNCSCGHDHDEEELETMILTLDDDTELECAILGVFDVEGKEYIALLSEEDETVLLYEYKEVDDEAELGLIESDEEFEKVSNAFNDFFDEEYDEEEEDDDKEEK